MAEPATDNQESLPESQEPEDTGTVSSDSTSTLADEANGAASIDLGVQFPPASEEPAQNLQNILSMKVPVIIKIAEKTMKLENVMKLNIGTIIQFEKDAYQHIDLMVNNHTIGLGQPVKIGENFGLRITHIGDITDTIRSLGMKS